MSKRMISVLITSSLLVALVSVPIGDATAKKKKKKKAPACAAYVPGELGAEAEHVVVTDAHTAEKPLAYPISLDPNVDEGATGDPPTANVNAQVDSKAASAGLYVTFEFQSYRDYDLWAYFPDGSGAASAHGFQPLIDTQGTPADLSNTESNHAGESAAESENLVGVITPDCGGYTISATNYFGEGGEFELKLWLGEGKTEPGVPE
jgi:hypothetical protein